MSRLDYRYHPAVRNCAAELSAGGVIAYPTEAVWGLGCDPFNRHAVERVLTLKQRQPEKGLILVAADTAQIHWLVDDLPENLRVTLEASWPGHITWLIPHRGRVPGVVSGSHDTIAVRVSTHPVVRALCQLFGGPIVSTSANPQGLPPARNGTDARRYFKGCELMFSAGTVGNNRSPSVIRDLISGRTLRA